jgi:hypothetical protein
MKKTFYLMIAVLFLSACSGLQVAMERQELEIVTSTDDIVFLDKYSKEKNVYVQVINASGHDDMDLIKSEVEKRFVDKNVKIVNQKDVADYIFQVRVGTANLQKKSAREVKGGRGEHSALIGGTAGGFAGSVSGGSGAAVLAGAAGGALVGGAADLTVNSWVKMGYITIVTDIQILEKTESPVHVVQKNETINGGGTGTSTTIQTRETKENYFKYRLRAVSRASQVNMEWEDCKDAFHGEIINIVTGII